MLHISDWDRWAALHVWLVFCCYMHMILVPTRLMCFIFDASKATKSELR